MVQVDETLKINPIYEARNLINMLCDKLTGRGKIKRLCGLIASEPQLGSTLFLTSQDVLAFSCPVPLAELCIGSLSIQVRL